MPKNSKHIDWKLLLKITGLVSVWRLVLFLIGAVAPFVFPFKPSYPYYEGLLKHFGPDWLVEWAGFDGVHYITIIQNGYFGTGLIQAFFPVYPLLVYLFNWISNPIVIGILLSHFFFIGALYLWVLLLKKQNIKLSWIEMILPFLLFPSAFFFGAVYTESLFLFLVFLCLFLLKQKKLFYATIIAALASATRVVGIMLVPMMMVGVYVDWKQQKFRNALSVIKNLGISAIGSIGLLTYMAYLWIVFHDPLYFLHVQNEFGGGRQEQFILLPQVLYRYVKIFIAMPGWSWSYYAYAQELAITLLVVGVLSWITYKHWRSQLAELIFAWGIVLLPPLTGTLQSMPRYVLVAFPVFVAWVGLRKTHAPVYWALCAFSAVFLILNILLFIQGMWIA